MKRLTVLLILLAALFPAAARAADLDLEHLGDVDWPAPLPVWNVYWATDAKPIPFALSTDIDAATRRVLDSGYGAKLAQYGVPSFVLGGSVRAAEPCASLLREVVYLGDVEEFLRCETKIEGALPTRFRKTGSGDHIFNVILPPRVTAVLNPFGFEIARSCDVHGFHWFTPGAERRRLVYTVIPLQCRKPTQEDVLPILTHELVEAATDPVPLSPSWLDLSAGPFEWFRKGEAADICGDLDASAAQQAFQRVLFANTRVGAYWSNEDDACVVAGKRVVYAQLTASGAGSGKVLLDGVERDTPVREALFAGTHYRFAVPDSGPDTRYLLFGDCEGTITFPAGNTDAHPAQTADCSYVRQYRVRFDASGLPAGAFWTVTVNGTPYVGPASAWISEGVTTSYAYGNVDACTRTSTSPASPVTVTAPLQVTATYSCAVSTTYADLVRSDNPIGYWRLGEPGRLLAVDSSGHGLDGVYDNGVTGVPGAIAGDGDEAAHFAGPGVSVPAYAALNLTGQVSVEAWVRSSGPGFFGYVVAKSDFHGTLGYAMYTGASNTLRFFVGMGGARITPDTSFGWDGAWHHAVGVYDGTSVRLYVDKVLIVRAPASGPIADSTGRTLAIGRYNDSGFPFGGDIDEVAVYDYALSEDQLHAHYNKAVFG